MWIFWAIVIYIAWSVFSGRNRNTGSTSTPYKPSPSRGTNKPRQSRRFLTPEKPDIELSDEFKATIERMENSSENLFITGRAGTGKSTLLKYFRATTKKSVVVVAPTGVAAVNVQGQTIHSFFKFGIHPTIDKMRSINGVGGLVYKNIDAVIIDEVSMVRADLFDCVEKFLRFNGKDPKKPFGGVQIITFGDLYQLPPIVTDEDRKFMEATYKSPYFFDSYSYEKSNFHSVELRHVYRQSDLEFIKMLDAMRLGNTSKEHVEAFNQCLVTKKETSNETNVVKLVTTNAMANTYNLSQLRKLTGQEYVYRGRVEGEFPEKSFPTEMELVLKKGAQVMLLNNEPMSRWVNGDIGTVLELTDTQIKVLFDDETYAFIDQNMWEIVRYILDEEDGKVKPEVVGSFTQYPLRLAWAVTIHKGQGKTFDKVSVNFGSGTFAPGQAYVAISRCRTLEGLTLEQPLRTEDVFADERVNGFFKQIHSSGVYMSGLSTPQEKIPF
jgi:ATP-dependent exoDNAse (exonuclease V) alpha subunit